MSFIERCSLFGVSFIGGSTVSKYESAVDDSEVFFRVSSSGYMSSIAEWNDVLFNVSKSYIYRIVLLNLLASIRLQLIKFLIYLLVKKKEICHQWCTICSHWNPYALPVCFVTYIDVNIVYQVIHISN